LTYSSWSQGELRIHIRDLATGQDRVITPAGRNQGYATFSPDGTRIMFVEYTASGNQIRLMGVAPGSGDVGAGPRYAMIDGQYISGSFSPDGNWVVVNDPASKETRLVDVAKGGDGERLPWSGGGLTGWQRLAP
jgi:TolB protein